MDEITKRQENEKAQIETATRKAAESSLDKIEIYLKPLDIFSEGLKDLINLDLKSIEIPELPPIPVKSGEINLLIKNLEAGEKDLESVGEEFWKVLSATVEDVKEFKYSSTSDLPRFKSLLGTANQVINSLKKTEAKRKLFIEQENSARKELVRAKVSEAGFYSLESLEERIKYISDEISDTQERFWGLGRLVNRQQIKKLTDKHDRLTNIEYLRHTSDKYYHNPHSYKLENTEGALAESLVLQFKNFSNLAVKELEKTESGHTLELSPKTLDQLNDTYIDQIVRDKLAELIKEKKGRFRGSLGSKADRDRAMDLLKQTFDYESVVHMGNTWREPEELKKKKDVLREEINNLPMGLSDFIRVEVNHRRVNDIWEEFHNGLKSIKSERWLFECRKRVYELQKMSGETKNWNVRRGFHGLGQYDFPLLEQNKKQINDVVNLDLNRLEIFNSSPGVRNVFGDRQIEEYKGILSNKLLHSLCTADNGQQDYVLARNLIKLKAAKMAPFILLDAFRVGGDGGGYHLIGGHHQVGPDQTDVYKFITSFESKDEEQLRAANIPGLIEAIELIKNNKDNFCRPQVNTAKNKYEYKWTDNPVYKNIQSALTQVSCHLLQNGNGEEKVFALRALSGTREPLGIQADVLRKILKEGSSYHDNLIIDKTKSMLMNRFSYEADLESAVILLEAGAPAEQDGLFRNADTIIHRIATNWDNLATQAGKEGAEKNLNSLRTILLPEIKKMIGGGDVKDKFLAYVCARNLDIELTPSVDNILAFFNSRSAISNQGNFSNGFESEVSKLAESVSLSEADSYKLADVITRIYCSGNFLGDASKKDLLKLIESLPIGDKFSVKDKNALSSLPDLLDRERVQLILQEILLSPDQKIDEANWTVMLNAYTLVAGEVVNLDDSDRKIIHSLFSNEHQDNRDLCLRKLRTAFEEFLADKSNQFSIEAISTCETIRRSYGEAGDLKYVSALANLINSVRDMIESKNTAPRTKTEVLAGLREQEKRMLASRWSEDERASFCNISTSILKAAPSLYSDFIGLFGVMSGKEMEKFAKELYPLYQANLVVLEKGNEGSFNPRDLVPIRRRLEAMKGDFQREGSNANESLEREKSELIKSIQQTFEKRFGLLKIPEDLTEEHIRTLQNCVRYVGNINGRDQTKEALISLYLGLMINGKWEDFRSGSDVNLAEYFSGESLKALQPILEKRQEVNKIPPDIIGLSPEDTLKFQGAMQEETISNMIGNVQTIDIKLGNAKRNLEELTDPDIYPDEADRAVLALVNEEGKLVGGTLSKIYAETAGKNVVFSENEGVVRKNLESIYKVDKWTPAKVKEIQDRVQVPNLICSVLRKLDEEDVDIVIGKLQSALTPSKEIIEVFNSFGEEFKLTSGALALSQDLSYLENIIVKNENKISADQKRILDDYLSTIRSQMSVLESVYARVKEYFDKIRKGAHVIKNDILNSRLKEIEKVLYQSDSAVSVTTRVTTNLNLIIENMRQCLGCLSKEINNDTNLTFGDYNKFYVMSQGEKEKGSIADEIVSFAPIKMADGSVAMSFVLDRIYGSKSSDILLAHIKAVAKKYSSLKKAFPDAKTSVFVTDSALYSAGFSKDQAEIKIKEILGQAKVTSLEGASVTISESALGEHYVEFGDHNGRYKGETIVSGLKIEI